MVWTKNASPKVDAESRYPTIITVNAIFTFLMLAAVTTRIVTRKSSLGADDYIVVVTAVFSVVYNCFSIAETHWGLGLPIALRPHANTHTFKILSYAGKPWYQFGICGFKLALCISYLRFLRGLNSKEHHVYRWTIIGVAAFSTLFHATATMVNFFFCMPLAKNFDASVPGHCINFLSWNYSIAAITILCDVMVFTLPTQIFRRLQMDRRVKYEICAMFLLGLLTTVCSIWRATYFRQVEDGNGDSTMVVLLGTVEFNVGLIACCLPFMRGIILKSWSDITSSSKKASNGYALNNYRSKQSSRIERSTASKSDSQENIFEEAKNGRIIRTVSYHINQAGPDDEG